MEIKFREIILSSISHEIRTPTNGFKGILKTLKFKPNFK